MTGRAESPVGTALWRARRARAFAAAPTVADDTAKAGAGAPTNTAMVAAPIETKGLPQSMLDDLCIDSDDEDEESADEPLTPGLSQSQLDAIAIGAPDEDEAEARAAGRRPGLEEVLYRARRLRAFRGADEAATHAYEALPQSMTTPAEPAFSSDMSPKDDLDIGLSQAALDEMAICPPSAEGAEPTLERPEATCFLLRRLRAYRSAAAATEMAASLSEKAKAAAQAAQPAASERGGGVPIHVIRGGAPCEAGRLVDESPCKDTKDSLGGVATPQRMRMRSRCGPDEVAASPPLRRRGGA